jgi:DNA-binding transcriptional regulator YdaS (Cro superfamily)
MKHLKTWITQLALQRGVSETAIRTELGIACGVNRHTIWLIAHQGKSCSATLASAISAATGGEVSIQELLYPNGLPEGAAMCPRTDGSDDLPSAA